MRTWNASKIIDMPDELYVEPAQFTDAGWANGGDWTDPDVIAQAHEALYEARTVPWPAEYDGERVEVRLAGDVDTGAWSALVQVAAGTAVTGDGTRVIGSGTLNVPDTDDELDDGPVAGGVTDEVTEDATEAL